jgi:hypothetical protein
MRAAYPDDELRGSRPVLRGRGIHFPVTRFQEDFGAWHILVSVYLFDFDKNRFSL